MATVNKKSLTIEGETCLWGWKNQQGKESSNLFTTESEATEDAYKSGVENFETYQHWVNVGM